MTELANKWKNKLWLTLPKKAIEKENLKEVTTEETVSTEKLEATGITSGSFSMTVITDDENDVKFRCHLGGNCKENDEKKYSSGPKSGTHKCLSQLRRGGRWNYGEPKWANHFGQNSEDCFCYRLGKVTWNDLTWHEKCFCCTACGADLKSKHVVFQDDNLHCQTCYHQKYQHRCPSCNQIVSSSSLESIRCGEKIFHKDCLICVKCNVNLFGERFKASGENYVCTRCLSQIEKVCQGCAKSIKDEKYMTFDDSDLYWHQDCFVCNYCKSSVLAGREVSIYNRRIIKCSVCLTRQLEETPKQSYLDVLFTF